MIVFSVILFYALRLWDNNNDIALSSSSNTTIQYRSLSRQMKLERWVKLQIAIQSSISPNTSVVVYTPNSSGGLGNAIRGYITTVLLATLYQIPFKCIYLFCLLHIVNAEGSFLTTLFFTPFPDSNYAPRSTQNNECYY